MQANCLLSQEGSTIETAVEIVRGVVPEPSSLRMHSETFRWGNHPSRHRKVRDDAALLTQEGSSATFDTFSKFEGGVVNSALRCQLTDSRRSAGKEFQLRRSSG